MTYEQIRAWYRKLLKLLNPSPARQAPARMELSAAAKAARRPLAPEELIDAQQDGVHCDTGRVRAARVVRINSATEEGLAPNE